MSAPNIDPNFFLRFLPRKGGAPLVKKTSGVQYWVLDLLLLDGLDHLLP